MHTLPVFLACFFNLRLICYTPGTVHFNEKSDGFLSSPPLSQLLDFVGNSETSLALLPTESAARSTPSSLDVSQECVSEAEVTGGEDENASEKELGEEEDQEPLNSSSRTCSSSPPSPSAMPRTCDVSRNRDTAPLNNDPQHQAKEEMQHGIQHNRDTPRKATQCTDLNSVFYISPPPRAHGESGAHYSQNSDPSGHNPPDSLSAMSTLEEQETIAEIQFYQV